MAANNIHHGKIAIPSQPATPIHYSFIPGSGQLKNGVTPLLIFLSGLNDPRKLWTPVLRAMNKEGRVQGGFQPAMLLYDRFGSGETAKKTTKTHDAMDATKDLRELIVGVTERHLKIQPNEIDSLPIIFVAHSFGGVIAELYAKQYPRTVIALLLIDSCPTDTDGESWFPDPDASDFKSELLPDGITADMLRKVRAQHRTTPYNPNSTNKEGIKWNNLSTYIPEVGRPQLIGPWENTPLLTTMRHDPLPFAEQAKKVCAFIIKNGRIFPNKY
jgi:pimeloyl-ACP methyl ester carboxylesterase